MLLELHVRKIGVLEDVSVSFAPGLNVVTGETGAGKTLLVTSLALLTGARPPPGEALVEVVAVPTEAVRRRLDERGLEAEEELILARRVGADGRSRACVAGMLVPVGALGDIGSALVEIHGQGASFALARQQAQLDALDAFAGCLDIRRRYEATLRRLRELGAELERIAAHERERARTIDVLTFQVTEIERARIDPVADATVSDELHRLQHAERLRELGALAADRAGSDGGAGALGEAAKALEAAARTDPSAAAIAERAAAVATEAADLAAVSRVWLESIDDDPQRLESLRERVAVLAALRRKYGETMDDVLAFARDARATLAELERTEARADELLREQEDVRTALGAAAAELTASRTTGAARLSELIRRELPALALRHARFDVVVSPIGADGEHGRDRAEFMFSADPARASGPLGKIASGGELSRVMIAVTLAVAGGAHTLVFDEADQGVGGQAALDVARRLKRLADSRQVLVVTHLPQIAAFADRHIVVDKTRLGVGVRVVEGDARLHEISRMLSGLEGSARAKAHAAELIELATDGVRQPKKGRVVAGARTR
jgi:DNA repair protein RecN (Recombination protein N)